MSSRANFRKLFSALVITALFAVCAGVSQIRAAEPDQELLQDAQSNFKSLAPNLDSSKASPDMVDLGRKLFFDPRISVDGTVSCMRCHQIGLYATDSLPKSRGAHDELLPRNAPTILNVRLNFKMHWRGDFKNVEEQATHALTGPGFANPNLETAMLRIKAIPGYDELFRKAFPKEPDPVSADNWGNAIGAYERTLATPSRFDKFLDGSVDALTAEERHGLRTFIDVGCINCHNGEGVGGQEFEKFGVYTDYWKETCSQEIDPGRYSLTKNSDDMYVFKVPVLRNVAMTPPYFHDGSVAALAEAVKIMAKVQLGKSLSDTDKTAIVAFLTSLTGTLPDDYAKSPLLPAAGYMSAPSVSHSEKP